MSYKRRIINAVAPIRICDLGGWTDTWFAENGNILNIGVYPYAETQIYVSETTDREGRIIIHAENFGERYLVEHAPHQYDRHPLLEASIDIMNLPKNLSFEINLYSSVPAGCSTGTSAAVTVALLGALDLLTPGRRTPHEIAILAHRVETEKLKLQCGIQDQLCSAYGGICYMEMFRYPFASVSQLDIPDVINSMLAVGRTINAEETGGTWLDIIYPWDMISLNNAILSNNSGRVGGTIETGAYLKGLVSVGKGTIIRSNSYIVGPVVIGNNCDIGPNVTISPYTSIGDNLIIAPFSLIENSVLGDDTRIGPGSIIQDSVIDKGCVIKGHFTACTGEADVAINDEHHSINIGAMLGVSCTIGNGVVAQPGVIVGNYCQIQSMKLIRGKIPDRSYVL